MLEANTDRMWFVIGTILIGSGLVIAMKEGLTNGYSVVMGAVEEFIPDIEELMKEPFDPTTIVGAREEDGYVYANIRPDGMNRGDTGDVWVRAKIESDDTLIIQVAGPTESNFDINDLNARSHISGSLVIPNTINGRRVKAISVPQNQRGAFIGMVFNGSLTLGDFLEDLGGHTFQSARFTGRLDVKNIKRLNSNVLYNSVFTGSFNPKNVNYVGSYALRQSRFTGTFNPGKITFIDGSAFYSSNFSGTFNPGQIEVIRVSSFRNSTFSGPFDSGVLTRVDESAFLNSNFTTPIVPAN